MKLQIIEFVTLNRTVTRFEDLESFSFRKDKPAHWLQKACFFVLRKLGAFKLAEAVKVERHVIDPATFMEKLFKQQGALIDAFGRRPARLLIGAEDFAKFMGGAVATEGFRFQAEYYQNNTVMGLTVEVIPWMRGVLVMPSRLKD